MGVADDESVTGWFTLGTDNYGYKTCKQKLQKGGNGALSNLRLVMASTIYKQLAPEYYIYEWQEFAIMITPKQKYLQHSYSMSCVPDFIFTQ